MFPAVKRIFLVFLFRFTSAGKWQWTHFDFPSVPLAQGIYRNTRLTCNTDASGISRIPCQTFRPATCLPSLKKATGALQTSGVSPACDSAIQGRSFAIKWPCCLLLTAAPLFPTSNLSVQVSRLREITSIFPTQVFAHNFSPLLANPRPSLSNLQEADSQPSAGSLRSITDSPPADDLLRLMLAF